MRFSPDLTGAPKPGRSSPRSLNAASWSASSPTPYLVDVITRIANGHLNSQLDDLLPWAYMPAQTTIDVA